MLAAEAGRGQASVDEVVGDGDVLLLDTRKMCRLATLSAHDGGGVHALAWTRGGRFLATGGDDGRIALWSEFWRGERGGGGRGKG